jgi:hypothetical protein
MGKTVKNLGFLHNARFEVHGTEAINLGIKIVSAL